MAESGRIMELGPLSEVAREPGVTDIAVTCDGSVWVDGGDGMRLRRLRVPFDSAQSIRNFAVRLCSQLGRRLDDACPIADASTVDGVRVHAVIAPLVPQGAAISIRLPDATAPRLESLAHHGMFPPAWLPLLRGLVRRKATMLVTGGTGAGKTTIMKMILGLTPITSGEVDVFGQNIKGHEKRIYPRIGAIIETPGFYPNLTGTENLEIFAKLRGTPRPNAVKNALEVVGLPYRDKKLFSKYSLGMKQRLGIANAILHDPELLILDEPTNGLDPIGIAEVRNFIKDLSVDRGKTILISSHILSEIALLADDIGIIDHGVLLEESSMEDLEKKNRKYIQLQVSDVPKASLILERQFHVTDYAVQDEHNLRLYDTALDMAAINKALVIQDVAVISSQICNDTLEDYFKEITGGVGIA